jgi:D-alanyl-D-alanine dipeptidase
MDSEGYFNIDWIAQLIASIYQYGLALASILAVVVIIFNGIKIIGAGTFGGDEKMNAYKAVGRVAIGMIIAWGSYLILYNINPELVNLKAIRVKLAQITDKEEYLNTCTDNGENYVSANPLNLVNNSIPKTEDLIKIDQIEGIKKENLILAGFAARFPYINKSAAEALKNAVSYAQIAGKSLVIKTTFRDLDSQINLWQAALKKFGSDDNGKKEALKCVTPPSPGAPHLTGKAIDVCLSPGQSCNHIIGKENNFSADPDIQLLRNIMSEARWSNYCKEWWHWENGLNDYPNRSSGNNTCK